MIVLDTNVISELMRPEPNPQVTMWVARQTVSRLFTTTVTMAEVLYGIKRLEPGRRRNDLMVSFEALLSRGFRDRILSFDGRAADSYSDILVARRKLGRSIEVMDAMIAGIAVSRGAEVATRNTSDFEACGLKLVNPWA